MKIAYNTWSMPAVPYEAFIPHLARVGFEAVIITVKEGWATDLAQLTADDRRRMKALLREHRLPLAGIVGNQPIIGEDPETVRHRIQRLRDAIDLCVELAEGDAVPMNTGSGGRSQDWEAKHQQLVDRVGELVDYAAPKGVVVCLEPHVSATLDTPERSAWLVDHIDSPYCKLDFDASHFEVVGIAMEEYVPLLAPRSASVEIKDQHFRYTDDPATVARRPPAADERHQPSQEPDGWGVPGNRSGRAVAPNGREVEYQFLLPGEGTFDLPRYLRLMREAGWDGPIGFEVSVQCQARPDCDPLVVAERCYHWMLAGWQAAGLRP